MLRTFLAVSAAVLSCCSAAFAHANYTGYSGAPLTQGRCASSCHGSGTGTVTVTGFPAEYVPDSTYLISLAITSGSSIKNFNASVRRGTDSLTAGVITAGQFTATYNVSREHNGVHLSSNDHTTATFNWTAPAAGLGTVRMYLAAHQGNTNGANTNFTLVASEIVTPQPPATPVYLSPTNGAALVSLNPVLSWNAAARAEFYQVYFGGDSPPALFADSVSAMSFELMNLAPATSYNWQIRAVNDVGTTEGAIWTFTTLTAPGQTSSPFPDDGMVNVPLTTFFGWDGADRATAYIFHLGTSEPLSALDTLSATSFTPLTPLQYNTSYLWRVDAMNEAGVTEGETWGFSTPVDAAAHEFIANEFRISEAYPNPFNSTVNVSLSIPQTSQARVEIFDLSGRLVSTLLDGSLAAGSHELQWNASGQSAGTYFLRTNFGQQSFSQKLIYLP